ncbi:hypothetical protein ElyMa_005019500 [Elysia marginata]|uniref:Uncharacterized protein n=1 Tax=Elysia marginata TaxID=1093978 RepID=A0AAV4JAX5_9GAST|nr:hypothetical protein ElyMa_005019500 [Elysia marginata]
MFFSEKLQVSLQQKYRYLQTSRLPALKITTSAAVESCLMGLELEINRGVKRAVGATVFCFQPSSSSSSSCSTTSSSRSSGDGGGGNSSSSLVVVVVVVVVVAVLVVVIVV